MLTGSQRRGKFAKFIKILQKSGACLFHTSLELYLVNRLIAEKPSPVSFIIHSPHFYWAPTVCQTKCLFSRTQILVEGDLKHRQACKKMQVVTGVRRKIRGVCVNVRVFLERVWGNGGVEEGKLCYFTQGSGGIPFWKEDNSAEMWRK